MALAEQSEKYEFQSDVAKVLKIVINSLYSHSEISIRELISNASDALDKMRYQGMSDTSLYEGDTDLKIGFSFDRDKRTLTIHDNGIGMDAEEVKQNLGTIARSGTQQFIDNLSSNDAKASNLIGQFGVGFYSAFIIADEVTVETKKPNCEAVRWHSDGTNSYEITSSDKQTRGTDVILHLKKDQDEFLNPMRIRHIVRTYSDHISFPIHLPKDEATLKAEKEKAAEGELVEETEVVNQANALWTVNRSDITTEQYDEFYRHVAHDFAPPALTIHKKVEGKFEYTMLVFVPSQAPFDLYQLDKPRGLKLYVKRVFIMDDAQQLLPTYMRFVRGVVDSADLPLNVSRELLQSSRVVETIKSAVTKNVLKALKDLATNDKEKYQSFWSAFGPVMKEGPAEDFANREAIAELLRFSTTHDDSPTQATSLDDVIARMPESQDKIYYLAADTFNAAKNSPHLEVFRKKGVEVLLLSDRIDEWLMSHLTEYKGKQFQSVARGSLDDLDFVKDKDKKDETTELPVAEYEKLITAMKTSLGEKVKEIRLTERLTTSPACLVADENAMTAQMARVLKSAGQQVDNPPILELNPEHELVKKLNAMSDQKQIEDWTEILFNQALLSEGGQLDDPASFVKKFNEMLLSVMQR